METIETAAADPAVPARRSAMMRGPITPIIDMIEINPILAQIADLKGRVESLRGYL
jgi:hypothetical protein